MKYQDNIILTENNYIQYETDLSNLYNKVFEEPPYNEKLSSEELKKKFQKWFTRKDNMVILKLENETPISFCVGYRACCVEEEKEEDGSPKDGWETWKTIKKKLNLREIYFIDELGTLLEHQGQGYATKLMEHLIYSNTDQYSKFLLKTRKNSKAVELYEDKFHFNRLNSRLQPRNYIFFYLDKTIKKVRYMMLLPAKVNVCGEELVNVNHYNKEILLQKADIGLFPYENGGEYGKVREEVAKKLSRVNEKLMKRYEHYRLNVSYGFRSMDIQNRAFHEQREKMAKKKMTFNTLYDFVEEIHRFIAVPTVAGHPTGGAVDLTIKDIERDDFLDMGSLIYEFSSDRVTWEAKGLTLEQKRNRQILYDLMVSEGFAPFWGEWWHYSYGDREWSVYYNKPHAIYDQIK